MKKVSSPRVFRFFASRFNKYAMLGIGICCFCSAQANSAGNLSATWSVSPWSGGYTAYLSVKNNGTAAVNGWTAKFTTPHQETSVWNATLTGPVANVYSLTPATWTSVIGANGGSVTIGFTFNGAPPQTPTNFIINGQLVILNGGVSPTPTPFPTATPKPTATPTPTHKPTATPTPTHKPTATPTPSPTATPKPSPSATPTPTPKPSPTTTPTPVSTPSPTPLNGQGHHLTGYFPSWSDSWYSYSNNGVPLTDAQLLSASKLAQVSTTPYTDVYLAFALPNFSWNGLVSNNWTGTGLNFTATPADVAQAIRLLHNAGQRVILSVGGATYNSGWTTLAAEAGKTIGSYTTPTKAALVQFMTDLKLDGLDVDFEVDGATTSNITLYAQAIQAMREAVDAAVAIDQHPRKLALAAWSTGADYTAQTPNPSAPSKISYWGGSAGRERMTLASVVASGNYTGKQIASLLNEVNVMAYDAGDQHYDPVIAYDEYRSILPASTVVSIGLEIPPESWGGAVLVVNNSDAGAASTGTLVQNDQYGNVVNAPYAVERFGRHLLANTINVNPHDGLMVWDLLLTSSSKVTTASGGSAITATPSTIATEAVALFGGTIPNPTPSPSATPSPSPTATPVPTPNPTPTPIPSPSPVSGSVVTTGQINFHYYYGISPTVAQDGLILTGDNYTDLIMANIIAGVMYGHLIQECTPGVQFNPDYLYGSIFGQLLQENLATEYYTNTSSLIDPSPNQQAVMGVGQGGPYQINNYAADMVAGTYAPAGFSLINFVALQKNIGYSMSNAAVQYTKATPPSFNNKYYGPMLTAYFHFNDYRALQYIGGNTNSAGSYLAWSPTNYNWIPPWQPSFGNALNAFKSLQGTQLDILLNIAYNAGYYAQLFVDQTKASAFSTTATVQSFNSLTNAWAGDSYHQYPYQVRGYLDQLYDRTTPNAADLATVVTPNNHVAFNLTVLSGVFSKVFQTLATVDASGNYHFISDAAATSAFTSAVTGAGYSVSSTLDLSNAHDRALIFSMIDSAISNLEKSLNTSFSATTLEQL